jgi:hypothetical protein
MAWHEALSRIYIHLRKCGRQSINQAMNYWNSGGTVRQREEVAWFENKHNTYI